MIYQTMIDAFILQGYLSRHVELSRNMMDKNKAMHNEFKLHLKEYSNFLGPGSTQILPQYQDIYPQSEFISTLCVMSSSWKIVDLRQGRQKADVFDRMLSRYFFRLQTVCPSSYRFCFVFRNVFSISVDSRFHRTILLAKKRSILSAAYVFVYT